MKTLLVVVAALAACGDGNNHHLADAPPGLDAIFATDAPPADVALHVTKDGTGTGTITSSPDGIACGSTCDVTLAPGSKLTLTAVADDSSTFTGWTGGCTGTTPTCDVTVSDATTVNASFAKKLFAVNVTKSGAGTGAITGGGIDCGATCTATVDYGTQVTLTAAPANLSTFAGWGGACSGTTDCVVTVTDDTDITANFALNDATLFVTLGGNGAGKVASSPAGIDCGATCQHTYSAGDMVTLTATPSAGSTFTAWSGGGCTGTAPCTVTLTTAATVTATFTLQTFALAVTKAGTGSGAVASNPAGIACGTACTKTFDYGTMVTLTPTPSTGSTFTSWSGACTGAGACVVTMDAAKTVAATFTLDSELLTVTKTGTGSGTVTGGGINCGGTCTATESYGQMVTLTAAAANGSTFTGWGGACTGTGACTVTMDAAKTVSAGFALQTFAVTVAKGGTGTGTVSGGMISCGATCTETVPFGTMVTLVAAPATGSTFGGWGGACSGTGSCVVTVTAATNVTATFTLQMFPLTVTKVGSGTVSGSGITCGTVCTEDLAYGTPVTLTAAAGTGSTFTGWSGACTGTGACNVTITAATNVTATFVANVTLTITKSGTGTGTVAGGAIACGNTCTQTVPMGTKITLAATPDSALATLSTFTGWSGGGCSGTAGCTVTLTADTTVNAAFNLSPNIVFVSSALVTGNVNGLAGADKTCQTLADNAGIKGTFVAYLSQSTQAATINAPSRVGSATGWVRVDGKAVMNAITGFQNGLFNPVLLDEKGNDTTNTSIVWTGTNKAGLYQDQCYGGTVAPIPWIGTSGSATIGISTATSAISISSDTTGCASARHLYCLGTDRKAVAQ